MHFFSFTGLLVVILFFLPNLEFARREQHDRPDDVATMGAFVCIVEVLSRLALCVVLICFQMDGARIGFVFPDMGSDIYGIASMVILLFDYLAWMNYYMKGAHYPDIYVGRFLGIPMPMDMCTILYYIGVSLWLNNLPALVISLVFGVCHFLNTWVARRDLKHRQS